jgi:hypothetical protein
MKAAADIAARKEIAVRATGVMQGEKFLLGHPTSSPCCRRRVLRWPKPTKL